MESHDNNLELERCFLLGKHAPGRTSVNHIDNLILSDTSSDLIMSTAMVSIVSAASGNTLYTKDIPGKINNRQCQTYMDR